MKIRFIAFLGALVAAAVCAAEPKFSIVSDRPDCLYRCGQTAIYTVTATDARGVALREGVVEAVLDNFGPKSVAAQKFDLSVTNVFSVSGTLNEPGFLRLSLSMEGLNSEVRWSVGFEPHKIRKGSPSPKDFDAYWAAEKARLAREVPPDVRLTPVIERSTEAFDFYRISLATFGRRVYGYLSVPKDRTRAPFPVDFEVNAAGFGSWTNDMSGRDDAICARFSVYPFEMDWRWQKVGTKAKYDALNAQLSKRFGVSVYSVAGMAEGRESYFYHCVILGIDRAVDWIVSRPDVDRSRVWYHGTSQGGGFGFYLCGLNKAFTKAAFFVPALTDTMGYLAGRQSGWPSVVENNSADAQKRAAAEKWAPYFDGANFASRITCPVRVVVGFSDITCPPGCVYSAFNEIRSSDKDILHGIGMGHSCRGDLYREALAWLRSGPGL